MVTSCDKKQAGPFLLGLHGKKGSGKSTLARVIQRRLGWDRVSVRAFADPIKEMCVDVLGLHPDSVYGTEEQKNAATDFTWGQLPGRKAGWLESLREAFWPSLRTGRMTGRQVMQHFGTELFRSADPDVWANCLLRRVARLDSGKLLVIVDDVRFPNEVAAIRRSGGYLAKLTRGTTSADLHASETALDGFSGWDYVAWNQATTPDETADLLLQSLDWSGRFRSPADGYGHPLMPAEGD